MQKKTYIKFDIVHIEHIKYQTMSSLLKYGNEMVIETAKHGINKDHIQGFCYTLIICHHQNLLLNEKLKTKRNKQS